MSNRIVLLTLLALALGLSACAFQPAEPEEGVTGEQSSSLTSGEVVFGTGQLGTAADTYAATQQGPGTPGDQLRGSGDPDKPQPDPWNPGQVMLIKGDPQGSPIAPTTNHPGQ